MTLAGRLIGTPLYMSPEQASGRTADVRSDLYALGVVLYEMATGLPPFSGETPLLLQAHVEMPPRPVVFPSGDAPELGALIMRLLAKSPDDRPATATEVVVRTSGGREVVHRLRKYYGLNERTCLNQRPVVREGDKVKKGQVIADGPSTVQGELSLGRNVLVAFMPWDGYNFEDAIIVSERLVKEDAYTSIHIEEFEVEIRETKLGKEEFTRDIPNVSEKMLRNLGETGVILPGTRVKPGDILVGKVAPKSKSELTPEEKLLHAIFGRAGEDVKNESLEVPSGVEGIVIDTRTFFRKTNLSPAEKKQIKERALASVKAHLGAKGLAEIAKVLGLEGGALEGLLSSKVEAAVHDLRGPRRSRTASPTEEQRPLWHQRRPRERSAHPCRRHEADGGTRGPLATDASLHRSARLPRR